MPTCGVGQQDDADGDQQQGQLDAAAGARGDRDDGRHQPAPQPASVGRVVGDVGAAWLGVVAGVAVAAGRGGALGRRRGRGCASRPSVGGRRRRWASLSAVARPRRWPPAGAGCRRRPRALVRSGAVIRCCTWSRQYDGSCVDRRGPGARRRWTGAPARRPAAGRGRSRLAGVGADEVLLLAPRVRRVAAAADQGDDEDQQQERAFPCAACGFAASSSSPRRRPSSLVVASAVASRASAAALPAGVSASADVVVTSWAAAAPTTSGAVDGPSLDVEVDDVGDDAGDVVRRAALEGEVDQRARPARRRRCRRRAPRPGSPR